MKWGCKKPGLWICWETKGKYWGWIEKSKFERGWFGYAYLEYNDSWNTCYYTSFKEAKEDITEIAYENEDARG